MNRLDVKAIAESLVKEARKEDLEVILKELLPRADWEYLVEFCPIDTLVELSKIEETKKFVLGNPRCPLEALCIAMEGYKECYDGIKKKRVLEFLIKEGIENKELIEKAKVLWADLKRTEIAEYILDFPSDTKFVAKKSSNQKVLGYLLGQGNEYRTELWENKNLCKELIPRLYKKGPRVVKKVLLTEGCDEETFLKCWGIFRKCKYSRDTLSAKEFIEVMAEKQWEVKEEAIKIFWYYLIDTHISVLIEPSHTTDGVMAGKISKLLSTKVLVNIYKALPENNMNKKAILEMLPEEERAILSIKGDRGGIHRSE